MPAEGDETKVRVRPFEELNTIAEAGRKRGIEVDWVLADEESPYWGSDEDDGAEGEVA